MDYWENIAIMSNTTMPNNHSFCFCLHFFFLRPSRWLFLLYCPCSICSFLLLFLLHFRRKKMISFCHITIEFIHGATNVYLLRSFRFIECWEPKQITTYIPPWKVDWIPWRARYFTWIWCFHVNPIQLEQMEECTYKYAVS